ncbi:F-box/LRR-repeat protein 7 [Zeugodacus cucurbitae]|uniref:F-box/LRR-repeat protein 7 n=1 Tax=Zeugodacus cucurbitae TaxID=28588 RepID=A0A0A1X3L2_ZEUCU|nr:F-box/LRR-repeat protein 7 [Zeugodacus cucurbitae]XP_054081144.1 F-box/LRR-repeat protein 7 [Zeugodacus cucurbitae]XP_054081145.1 F-box/LRR-repeat protein 7 [Zeugodacus cucurbitae]XP_054081146.1 F-box/LRR-repeat protein 7 [Zeugodacus cucurbitae]
MSHQTARRAQAPTSLECPLASLGRNSSAVIDSLTGHHQPPYHHPLSSSPLDPQVYQMSRKSPDLSIDADDIIYTPSASQQGDTVDGLLNELVNIEEDAESAAAVASSLNATEQRNHTLPEMYQLPHSGSHSGGTTGGRITRHQGGRCSVPTVSSTVNGGSTRNMQYFLEKKMDALYLGNAIRALPLGSEASHFQNERYFLEDGLRNICNYNSGAERLADAHYMRHHTSSPSETSGSDRYLLNRTGSPTDAFSSSNHLENFGSTSNNTASSNLALDQRFHHTKVKSLSDGLCNIGRFSPSLDQGYATLVSPSPTGHHPNTITTHSIVHHPPPSTTTLTAVTRTRHDNVVPPPWNKKTFRSGPLFDRLPDDVVLKIFNWFDSCELCILARVCRRFDQLAWRPVLWKVISLKGEHLNGDKTLKMIFRQLCGQTCNGSCPEVERVMLSEGCRISDKGLQLLTRRCPELTHLQLQTCMQVTNQALMDVLTKCTNLQHLDVTGCTQVVSISTHPNLEQPRRLLLQYLDLTDCVVLDDVGLKIVVKNCPQLVYLYLRRCIKITDAGLKFVPSFCIALKELSISDCVNITDFGLYELAKLGAILRYLSVAKCDRVSDAGLKVIARRCYKLRYLNARGCEAVSDDSITVLAHSCPRLRALDIGKCDVSDAGLRALAESCPNLKKLSLRNCDMITDRGVQCIAYYCRGLQQLNIQDCQISIEGYRAVKKYCKRCVIEHTNPGFC